MPLSQFEREGCPLEVEVPGLKQTLWFVPGEADADALVAEGVRRGRIWSAAELRDLLAAPGMTSEDAIGIAQARLAFNATVVDIRRDDPPMDPTPAHEEQPVEPVQPSLDFEVPPARELD